MAKARLDTAIRDWVSARGGGKRTLSQGELMQLVDHLGTEQRPALDAFTAKFGDRAAYPERPAVQLGDPKSGPTVWLLGWRQGDFTPIHDHGASRAAVHVYKGPLEETVFRPDTGELVTSRSIAEGATVPVPAPYIHEMGNSGAVAPEAASIHAYEPPLRLMHYYERGPDGKVEFVGKWEDDEVALARAEHERAAGGGN